MTPPSFSQKDGQFDLPVSVTSEHPPLQSAYFKAISPLTNACNRYSEWRSSFGLPNPGTVEQLQEEVKGDLFFVFNVFLDAILIPSQATLATSFLFEGGRADLTKSLSANPAFQVTHSFALGSQAPLSFY